MDESAVFDSVVEDALRLARRRWLLVVLVLLVGPAVGLVLATRSPSIEGTRKIEFSDTRTLAGLLGVTPATVDLDRAVAGIRDSMENADVAGSVRADASANAVRLTIVGDSSDEVEAQLDDFEAELVASVDGALRPQLETAVTAARQRVRVLEDVEATFEEASSDDVEVQRSRAELLVQLADARSRVSDVETYRSSVLGALFTSDETVFEDAGSLLVPPVVGGLVSMVLLSAGLGLVVVFDPRIRRRLQIERIAPRAVVLGVTPAGESSQDAAAELAAALDAFAESADLPDGHALGVLGLARDEDAETVIGLHELGGGQTRLSAAPGSRPPHRTSPRAPLVLVARFGQTTENELSSALAAHRAGGFDPLGVVLVGVPRRDLDWAGVSARN